MSVRDDLIAARALIDTPEKYEAMGKSISRALYEATPNWKRYFAADQAIAKHVLRGFGLKTTWPASTAP